MVAKLMAKLISLLGPVLRSEQTLSAGRLPCSLVLGAIFEKFSAAV
jgi:hypothetical protein